MSYIITLLAKEYNTIGIVGVVIVLAAYLLLQVDRLSQDSIAFSLMNFFGSILILVSLYYSWNLASGIIEISWLIISFFGLIKAIYLKKKRRHSPSV